MKDTDGFMISGFYGYVIQRGKQPGIIIPPMVYYLFKPKTNTEPASLVRVTMKDKPNEHFHISVAKVNSSQRIVHIPKDHQDTFIPGTECFVELAENGYHGD